MDIQEFLNVNQKKGGGSGGGGEGGGGGGCKCELATKAERKNM